MTRKQWINNLSDEEAIKIHTTFRQIDKRLFALPNNVVPKGHKLTHASQHIEFAQRRRTAVRHFLRTHKLSQKDLNVQYGRLAAGFGLNIKVKSNE